MGAWEEIEKHIDGRAGEIAVLRSKGVKIVGYTPGDFMPEELVWASGAVPICLVRGGEPEPVEASAVFIPRFIDTFCRAQIGYLLSEEEAPFYNMIDLLVVPITDSGNLRAIADCCDHYSDIDVFRFGVPHLKEETSIEYYKEGLRLLKGRLERVTGNTITEEKLFEATELYNRLRELLKKISLLRKRENPPLTGLEFVKLNHYSYLADAQVLVPLLDRLYRELEQKEARAKSPRIMLMGSTLALGDYKVLRLLEQAGASIVVESFMEGIRYYWNNVEPAGDPITALADKYYWRRQALGHFKPPRPAMDFNIDLAREFKVAGIGWYQLLYREVYDIGSFYFSRYLKEQMGIPMIKIESDYDPGEIGPLRTRLETFIEMARRSGNVD
ncbi:MAG: 2-hydroxyacyl-CoA dehydratase [Deltaproteobacteria bacterium]|nr:2-hydroxyacyl-CoA dehydratase [Deltaproteobacteria bacterium]